MQLIYGSTMLCLSNAMRVGVGGSSTTSTEIHLSFGDHASCLSIPGKHTPEMQRDLMIEIGRYMGTDRTYEIDDDLRLTWVQR